MSLEVTVTDQDGKNHFSDNKIYEANNLHFPHNKEGYLGLDYWDITAMDQIELGIKPHETDLLTFIIPLQEDTEAVDVEAVFRFIYEEDYTAVIHRKTEKVKFKPE